MAKIIHTVQQVKHWNAAGTVMQFHCINSELMTEHITMVHIVSKTTY